MAKSTRQAAFSFRRSFAIGATALASLCFTARALAFQNDEWSDACSDAELSISQSNWRGAEEKLVRALEIATKAKDEDGMMYSQRALGRYYESQHSFDEAIDHYKKAMALSGEKNDYYASDDLRRVYQARGMTAQVAELDRQDKALADKYGSEQARQSVYGAWLADVQQRVKKKWMEGPPFSDRSRTLTVGWDIDNDGTAEHARIVQSSGDHNLDLTAIKAVRATSPFPKPSPPELRRKKVSIEIVFDYHKRTN